MKILVTGSSGHLGEALMRTLPAIGHDATGLDIKGGHYTRHTGSVADRAAVRAAMAGMDAVLHTATLHKPHVATHTKQDFIDTNVTGTLTLLEEAVAAGVKTFVFTSTTSTFGAALVPPPGAPATWISEDVQPVPKNIYGATKVAAEDLCQLMHRDKALNCIILRTSRFFPEVDDNKSIRDAFSGTNTKANEFLYRRVDIEDAVSAHIAALDKADTIGFARYIISATTPFTPTDLKQLRQDATAVVAEHFPKMQAIFDAAGYRMFPSIERVYDNSLARAQLGWRPKHNFASILSQIADNQPIGSVLSREVGIKGYHDDNFADGPYPVA